MSFGRLKKIAAGFIEGTLAIALVLIFFMLFLYIINLIFPSTPMLKTMIGGQFTPTDMEPAFRRLLLSQGENESDINAEAKLAATIVKINNTLKSKRMEDISWKKAKEGMHLFDRDAVQTLRRSSAVIQFDKDNSIRMGESTLIIIKRLEKNLFNNDNNRSFLYLEEGEVQGVVTASRKTVYMKIATPSAKVLMQTREQTKENAEFKISVSKDKTSTISVYQGSVEVSAQGEKVIVGSNQSARVKINQIPSTPRALPEKVQLKAPEVGVLDVAHVVEVCPRALGHDHAALDRKRARLPARLPSREALTVKQGPPALRLQRTGRAGEKQGKKHNSSQGDGTFHWEGSSWGKGCDQGDRPGTV